MPAFSCDVSSPVHSYRLPPPSSSSPSSSRLTLLATINLQLDIAADLLRQTQSLALRAGIPPHQVAQTTSLAETLDKPHPGQQPSQSLHRAQSPSSGAHSRYGASPGRSAAALEGVTSSFRAASISPSLPQTGRRLGVSGFASEAGETGAGSAGGGGASASGERGQLSGGNSRGAGGGSTSVARRILASLQDDDDDVEDGEKEAEGEEEGGYLAKREGGWAGEGDGFGGADRSPMGSRRRRFEGEVGAGGGAGRAKRPTGRFVLSAADLELSDSDEEDEEEEERREREERETQQVRACGWHCGIRISWHVRIREQIQCMCCMPLF